MSERTINYKGVPLTVDYEYDAPNEGVEEGYGINQILAGEVDITPVFTHNQIHEITQLLKQD